MNDVSYRIVRTIRCKNTNVPGTLGKLTAATDGGSGIIIGVEQGQADVSAC